MKEPLDTSRSGILRYALTTALKEFFHCQKSIDELRRKLTILDVRENALPGENQTVDSLKQLREKNQELKELIHAIESWQKELDGNN